MALAALKSELAELGQDVNILQEDVVDFRDAAKLRDDDRVQLRDSEGEDTRRKAGARSTPGMAVMRNRYSAATGDAFCEICSEDDHDFHIDMQRSHRRRHQLQRRWRRSLHHHHLLMIFFSQTFPYVLVDSTFFVYLEIF